MPGSSWGTWGAEDGESGMVERAMGVSAAEPLPGVGTGGGGTAGLPPGASSSPGASSLAAGTSGLATDRAMGMVGWFAAASGGATTAGLDAALLLGIGAAGATGACEVAGPGADGAGSVRRATAGGGDGSGASRRESVFTYWTASRRRRVRPVASGGGADENDAPDAGGGAGGAAGGAAGVRCRELCAGRDGGAAGAGAGEAAASGAPSDQRRTGATGPAWATRSARVSGCSMPPCSRARSSHTGGRALSAAPAPADIRSNIC
ncbi:MAG: hypothetical protein U0547_05975 [Dehalococcoidia bacterium]